jgi:hypothetical protein
MIQWLIKAEGGKPAVIGIGLLPFNIERIRSGDPAVVFLRKIHTSLPDCQITISANMRTRMKDESKNKNHISFNFAADTLEKFLKRKWVRVPLSQAAKQDATVPNLDLFIFYAESVEQYWAEMQAQGIGAKEFVDERMQN